MVEHLVVTRKKKKLLCSGLINKEMSTQLICGTVEVGASKAEH